MFTSVSSCTTSSTTTYSAPSAPAAAPSQPPVSLFTPVETAGSMA